MKTILVGAAAFGCVTGPSGAGENGNPRLMQQRHMAAKRVFDRFVVILLTGGLNDLPLGQTVGQYHDCSHYLRLVLEDASSYLQ